MENNDKIFSEAFFSLNKEEQQSLMMGKSEPESPWIKVSDRLPKKKGLYFVVRKWLLPHEKEKVWVSYYLKGPQDMIEWKKDYLYYKPVILPEPPKE